MPLLKTESPHGRVFYVQCDKCEKLSRQYSADSGVLVQRQAQYDGWVFHRRNVWCHMCARMKAFEIFGLEN